MKRDAPWRKGTGLIVQSDPAVRCFHLIWDGQVVLASMAVGEKASRMFPDGHLRYVKLARIDGPNGKTHPLGRRMAGSVEQGCDTECPGCSGLSRFSRAFAVQKSRALSKAHRNEY